jgi:hypothetical protein
VLLLLGVVASCSLPVLKADNGSVDCEL